MKRRLLASLLSLVIVISLLPTAAWARNGEDDNNQVSPQTSITYDWKDYEGYYNADNAEGNVEYLDKPDAIGTLYDEIYAASDETAKEAVIDKALTDGLITNNLANRLKEVVHVYTEEELSNGVAFQKNADTSAPDFVATVKDGEMLIKGEGALMAYNKYNNVFYAPANTSIALRPWNTERAGQRLSSVRFGNGITEVGEYAFFNQPRTDITSASFNANLKIHLPDSLQKMSQATFMSLNVGKIAIPASVTSLSTRQFGTASAIYVLGDPEIKVSGSSASFATNSTAMVYTAKGSQLATTSGITNMTLREVDAIGACGADVGYTSEMVWTVDGDTLTITAMDNGSGVMANYSDSNPAPWNAYADQIKKIVLSSGVKTIGDNAFKTLTNVNDVTVPASVEIAESAENPFAATDLNTISFGYSKGSAFETWLKAHNYTGETDRDELGRVNLTTADNEYFHEYIGDTDIAAKMDYDGVLTIYPTYSANGDTNVPGVNGYNGDNTGFPWFDVFYDESYEPAFNDKNQLTNWSGAGQYQQYLKKIVWADGITDTGAYLFNNATNVPKDTPIELQIPDTVKTIGGFLIGGSAKSSPEVIIPENVTNVSFVINGVGGVAENVYILNPDLTTMPANKKPQDSTQEKSVRNICLGFNYTVHVKAGSKAYDKLKTGDNTIKTHTDMGACGVAPYSSNAFYLYDADTKTLTIKGSGAMADYAAAADAPWASYDVEKIEIADSITHIGDYAFASLLKIKETDVTIPNGATKGNHAFAEPDEHGRMPLPQSDDLYYNAYIGDTTIAAKMSKDGVITIYPTDITQDTVVPGIKGYDGDNTAFPWYESYGKEFTKDYTGVHASEIKEIVFADGLTEIGGYLFNSMTNMPRNNIKVHIPDSVTKVGGALVGSRNYGSTVAVGSQMSEVGFWYAGSASSVYILNPDMTGIPFAGQDATRNIAYATTGADIRMHVKEGSAAYNTVAKQGTTYTNVITHTDLGACGVAPYSSEVFWTYDEDSKTLTVLGDGAIKDYTNASDAPWSSFAVETLLVQSGVTEIGDNAFASLTGLKMVHVADSVEEVAETAFATENGEIANSLKNTTFLTGSDAMNTWLKNHKANVLPSDGVVGDYKWSISGDVLTIEVNGADTTDDLGEKSAVISSIAAGNEPAWTAYKSIITTVKIGYGVTEIGDKVFADMPVLSSVKLPPTLTKIGAEAFVNTPKLTKLYLPKKGVNVANDAFGTASSAAKNLTIQISPVAPASQKSIKSQGNTTITVDATKNLNVLLIGNSYFGALSGYMKSIAQGLGKSDAMIANYYFGGDSGNLAAYVQRIKNGEISYNEETDGFSGYKENGVRNHSYNHNPLSMGIEAEDWDYVVMETWGKNEPAGANGDGKLSQDPNLTTLKNYINKYASQAEVSLYHVYSCRSLAEQQEPKGTVLTDWQRYVNGADDGLNAIVAHVIPASTLIQNARLTYLNADGSELQRNPPSDITHLTGEGDYINAIMMYEMLTGTSAKAFDHKDFNNHKEAFYHQLVDVTKAAGMKKLTYAYVEHNGKTTYYDSLADAAAAAVKGDTLTIMAMPKSDETLQIAAGVTVKTFGSAANHTIVLNGGGAITENGLVAFTGNQVDSADVNDNANILVNYATGAISSYSPSDVAAQWTAYIESTNLGTTTVPGADMKYSEVPQIQAAMAKGYSDIWSATSADAAAKALEDSKTALLNAVKDYVKFLADTVYNNGEATIIGDKSYTVSKENYDAAAEGVQNAADVAGALSAYDAMLAKQVTKTIPTVTITANKATMTGSGTVKLTVNAPAGVTVEVTCDDASITVKDNGDSTFSAYLPNATKDYTFTLNTEENGNYTAATASCTVSVTRRTSAPSSGNTVSVPSTPNGTVTVTPSTATKDTTVTITTKPNEGYELGDLTVKDAGGNTLPLTDKGDGKYTFTMPDSKVVVEASFVKTAPTSFVDVPANAYFADAVKWAVDKGITNGLTDTMFGPYESCTRAQIVTFLWRAAGSPEPKTVSSFTDVPASAYYAKAVAWAVENGITNGMTETTFAPNATCTRGQSVTFLYRALKGTASGSTSFTDVASDAFYADAVNWAVANNVTNGTSATTFSPNADCTRAEIVTFLYRAYQGK